MALIAKSLQTSDMALVNRIRTLGFDAETAVAVDLLPLVHVAWADGSIVPEERATILRILDSRGICAGSEARVLVESLLEERPDAGYLEATLDLMRDLLATHDDQIEDLADLCMAVARVAGRLGFGAAIRSDEREMLDTIIRYLGTRGAEVFRGRLGEEPRQRSGQDLTGR